MASSPDSDQLRDLATAALSVAAVGAIVVARFVQKMTVKLTLLAVIGGLAASIWFSRVELGQCAEHCRCELLGAQIEVPTCRDRGTLRPDGQPGSRAGPGQRSRLDPAGTTTG